MRREEAIFFFCESAGTSPTHIIRHLILQLELKQPGLVLNALRKNPTSNFRRQLKVDQLLSIFLSMRDESTFDLYCIIDGLDQCISYVRTKSEVDHSDNITKFLNQLCESVSRPSKDEHQLGESPHQRHPKLAILLTTRPTPEIEVVTSNRSNRLVILTADVQERADAMIRCGIEALVRENNLSPEIETLIKHDLLKKSKQTGSTFQWAATSLKQLSHHSITSDDIADTLASFRPGIYALYQSVIDDIPSAKSTKRAASFLIELILFAREELSIEEIESIFMIAYGHIDDTESFDISDVPSILDILDACKSLLMISEDRLVRFRHPSVREFFLQLSTEAGVFCCPSEEAANLKLGYLCIRFLLLWTLLPVSETEINATKERNQDSEPPDVEIEQDGTMDRFLTLFNKHRFIQYAAIYWAVHIGLSGIIDLEYLRIIGLFLEYSKLPYSFSQRLLDNYRGEDSSDENWKDWKPLKPAAFLAGMDALNLIKNIPVKTQKSKQWEICCFRFNSRPRNVKSSFDFEIDIKERFEGNQTLLHIAALNGAFATTKYLLSLGARGEVFDTNGHTPFSHAVSEKNFKIAQELINRNEAYERLFDEETPTSLHMACMHGMKSIVRHLLKPDVEIDLRVLNGWTSLHVAAESGHADIATMLIERGADVDAVVSANLTPFHLTAKNGHKEVLEQLLLAKPNFNVNAVSESGFTPLYISAMNGHVQTFEYLQHRGGSNICDKNEHNLPIHIAASEGHSRIVTLAAEHNSVAALNRWGRAPIHLAATGGHLETVKELVRLGCDPDIKAKDLDATTEEIFCITPLLIAVMNGHMLLVDYILELRSAQHYGHIEVTGLRTSRGTTLLHLAAAVGLEGLVDRLIQDYGIDPLDRDSSGWTPLHDAIRGGHLKIVKALLSASKEDPTNVDNWYGGSDSVNPFMLAIQDGRNEVAQYLIEIGAKPKQVDKFGKTAAERACQSGTLETLELVLSHGVSPNGGEHSKYTPLAGAAARGSEEKIETLLRWGAKVDIEEYEGDTALHAAALKRFKNCFRLLIKAGADPCKRNRLGLTPIDAAEFYTPILEMDELKPILTTYQKIGSEEQRTLTKNLLGEYLRKPIYLHSGNNRPWDELDFAASIGELLLLLQRDADAIIAFEFVLDRRHDNKPSSRFICHACQYDGNKIGSWHICRTCTIPKRLCQECYGKEKSEKSQGFCNKDHAFLQIGGDSWEALLPNQVNAEGHTIEQWLASLRNEFDIVLSNEDTNQTLEAAPEENDGAGPLASTTVAELNE